MTQIKVTKCPIEGLYVIEPAVYGDPGVILWKPKETLINS